MAPAADKARAALADWLRERSAAVKACEQRAKAALYDKKYDRYKRIIEALDPVWDLYAE